MKNLGISFGIAFAASILFFCILNFGLNLDAHAAYGIAGLPFISSTHLCELLEQREGRKRLSGAPASHARGVYTFDKFAISPAVIVVYGVVIMVVVVELLGAVAGFLAAIADDTKMILAFSVLFNVIAAYLTGRWIGSRSGSRGIIAILSLFVLAVVIGKSIDFAIMSSADFKELYGEEKSLDLLLLHILGGSVILSISGLIGYWRGRRMRLLKYLRYLLGVLPKDTRDALVDLAYEEARNIGVRRAAA
jgi:hypothetical protein